MDLDPDPHQGDKPDPDPHQLKIRIRNRIKVISRIRIRIRIRSKVMRFRNTEFAKNRKRKKPGNILYSKISKKITIGWDLTGKWKSLNSNFTVPTSNRNLFCQGNKREPAYLTSLETHTLNSIEAMTSRSFPAFLAHAHCAPPFRCWEPKKV